MAPENIELDLGLNADLEKPGSAEKPKRSTEARGSRLPEDWELPEDWAEWAAAEGLGTGAVVAQANKFRDFWISKAGKDGRKANWEATWRNWVRNNLERNGNGRNGNSNKPKDSFLALAEQELGIGSNG